MPRHGRGRRPRGGDARVVGPQHIRNKHLIVTEEKAGATVSLPISAPLAESIMAARSGVLVFLLSEHGKPFCRKGSGNKIRQWCDEAICLITRPVPAQGCRAALC
jgi:hypothetical protein